MALLSRHVVALCGQAGRGEGGKVHSLSWWKKFVETLIDNLEEWSFGVRQGHAVFFIPALSGDGNDGDAGKVINQGSVGAVLPSTSFDGSHCVVKAWVVK